jgi:hypothetical protein
MTMKVGESVRKSIDDWTHNEFESAMLHACNAVDGTAKKIYPTLRNNERFTRFLRENYSILGPMGAPGIDVIETRFPVPVRHPTAAGGKPDLADVIYGIHRCTHGHGDELPEGFALIQNAAGPIQKTHMMIAPGKVRLSDRIIFGLIAVAVLSPVNKNQSVPDTYYLTFGASEKLMINEWWGRAADFSAILAREVLPLIKLDCGDWMA